MHLWLARAIQGKGAFRRFKDELHEEYPDLLPAWYAFRDAGYSCHEAMAARRSRQMTQFPHVRVEGSARGRGRAYGRQAP